MFSASQLFAQTTLKIGYTSADAVLAALPEAKQIESDLKTYQTQLGNQLQSMKADFEKKFADYLPILEKNSIDCSTLFEELSYYDGMKDIDGTFYKFTTIPITIVTRFLDVKSLPPEQALFFAMKRQDVELVKHIVSNYDIKEDGYINSDGEKEYIAGIAVANAKPEILEIIFQMPNIQIDESTVSINNILNAIAFQNIKDSGIALYRLQGFYNKEFISEYIKGAGASISHLEIFSKIYDVAIDCAKYPKGEDVLFNEVEVATLCTRQKG